MNCAFRWPKTVDCEISLVLHSKVEAKENTLNLYLVSLPPNVLLLDISSRSVRAIIDDRLGSGCQYFFFFFFFFLVELKDT